MLPDTKDIKSNEEQEVPNTKIQNKIEDCTGINKTPEQESLKQKYTLLEAIEAKDENGKSILIPAKTKILLI